MEELKQLLKEAFIEGNNYADVPEENDEIVLDDFKDFYDTIYKRAYNLSKHLVIKSFYCDDINGRCDKQCKDCKEMDKD